LFVDNGCYSLSQALQGCW